MWWIRGVVMVLASQVLGCDDDGTGAEVVGHHPLSAYFHVAGESATQEGDLSISCRFEWLYEVSGRPRELPDGSREVPVQWGGDAQRTILLPDGSGLSLWPTLFSPESQVILAEDGGIELVDQVNLDAPSPFYQALGRLEGTLEETGNGSGSWACAPFGPGAAPEGGPVEDTVGVAVGTWSLTPIETTS